MNNLEIVGLLPPESQGTPIEDTLLEIFNGLPELSKQVYPDDIDICHIMPSDRKDGKLVAVCSRKMKLNILQAKKNSGKFTFKNHEIFINDHLHLIDIYLLWMRLKREISYKFLWTKNGSIFMREDDNLPVKKIVNEDCIMKLARSGSNAVNNDVNSVDSVVTNGGD